MHSLALCALLLVATPGAASAPAPADPGAPTVGASLDKSEVHVGDRVHLTVSAVARAGIAVSLPPKLDLGKLELLDRDDGDRAGRDLGDGRRAHRFVLTVAAYDLGDLEIPAIPVSYIDAGGEVHTALTTPVTLHVKSLVAENQTPPKLQPPRPPRASLIEDERVMAAVRWGAIGLGGALVLLVGFLLIRRAIRRRRGGAQPALAPVVPGRPPEEIAMERLKAIRAAGHFSRELYRPFYFEVAEVVRAYLGARYRFDSLELTSRELLGALAEPAPHLARDDGEVARFLDETDLVKFAKTGSTDEAALRVLDAAQAIVLSTAAPLETVAQAVSGPVLQPRPLDETKEGRGG